MAPQGDLLDRLVVKPTMETLPDGTKKPSWPAPWMTGEHSHAVWRRLVVSADKADQQVAADLYGRELTYRWIRASEILVRAYGGRDTARITAGLAPLDDHHIKAARRYREVFGCWPQWADGAELDDPASPAFAPLPPKGSPHRPPTPLPAAQMTLDMALDQEDAPPPVKRTRRTDPNGASYQVE